jgi:hypothetical protein
VPLKRGKSRKTIGENIAELQRSGYAQKQSVAIALHVAGKARKPRKRKKAK